MKPNNTRNLLLVGAVVLLIVSVAVYRQRGAGAAERSGQPQAASGVAGMPRILDLGADKCAACKELAPILADLKKEYAGRAIVDFIDVWKNPAAAEPYGVRIIPTQIFFDRFGKEVWRHEGFLERAEFVAKLKELGAG